jgi:hypothetical protein
MMHHIIIELVFWMLDHQKKHDFCNIHLVYTNQKPEARTTDPHIDPHVLMAPLAPWLKLVEIGGTINRH